MGTHSLCSHHSFCDWNRWRPFRSNSEVWDFHYDGNSNQREVVHNGGDRELYYYDEAGQRYMAVHFEANNTLDRIRVWNGPVETWYDGQGAVLSEWAHVQLGAQNIGRVENQDSFELSFHNGLQHFMGSVDLDTGAIRSAFVYGPYGEVIAKSEDQAAGAHLRQFNGKEADATSGLSYYGYRYYDPLSLTWTQADPLYLILPDLDPVEPRRASLYAFSSNNPVRYMDPDGRRPLGDSAADNLDSCRARGGCNSKEPVEAVELSRQASVGGLGGIGAVCLTNPACVFAVTMSTAKNEKEASQVAGGTIAGAGLVKVLGKAWAVVFGKSDEAVSLGQQALTAEANTAQSVTPARIRPTMSNSIESVDGRVVSASSVRGGGSTNLDPQVAKVLNRIPVAQRGAGHGCCGEPQNISTMLRSGIPTQGAISRSALVRSAANGNHLKPMPACSTCNVLLRYFGMIDGSP